MGICLVWLYFPSSHNLSLLSNAFRWSFAFNVLLGFCRSSAGIKWIAFNAIFLSGVLFVHRFRSLEISSINFLPVAPVGTIKIFLHQLTFDYMLLPDLSDISFQERYSNKSLNAAVLVPGLRYHCFHLICCCYSRWDLRCFFGGKYSNIEEALC